MKTGIYIHYPFCLSKCAYCDFNSIVNEDVSEKEILSALIRDLRYYHSLTGTREIDTIYFGGGTPSLMSPKMVGEILDEIRKIFTVKEGAEITLEANPLTAEIQKFQDFKKMGINRLSIGVQSFSDRGLETLGRTHNVEQAKQALKMAKNTFERSSFDLIYGWEGQTLQDWEGELKEALEYENGHISLYQLTIYEETPLARAGAEEICDEQSLLFQQKAKELLSSVDIEQYEISNYARAGQESQHNLIYWHYDDYIGIGAGASSRLTINGEKHAFMNSEIVNSWLNGDNPEREALSAKEKTEEYLLMGLRLNKGINVEDFYEKTGCNIVGMLENKGSLRDFICINNGYVFATDKGRACLNTLLGKLL